MIASHFCILFLRCCCCTACCSCEPSAAPLRVAVLVSGGVDSSLALQLVAAAGHKPTAFYLQVRLMMLALFGCCLVSAVAVLAEA